MILTLIELQCDSCQDSTQLCDGGIYSAADLRREARAEGWQRRFSLDTRMQRDLCPSCARKAGPK